MKRAAAVLLLALALVGCNLAQVVQLINVASLLAEQAAAVTGVIPPAYVAYVSAASSCVAFIAVEQRSTDTAAVRYDKDVAQCSKFVSVTLPPGTAKDLVDKAARLAESIQNILASLQPPSGVVSKSTKAPEEKPLSDADMKALSEASKRATAAAKKIAGN